ncbi:Cell wall endopeptidase, family M23/M37 [Cronobacter sakazakii 701]|nr:Cell wall endopeptidase, family M23/M37 [Cronobacter sakazakii 701]
MRGKAIFSMTWGNRPFRFSLKPLLYASALSAGVLLCPLSAHADDRDQLKSIQDDIAAKERAVRQQQQQRAKLLAQLKSQEQISPPPAASCAKPRIRWRNSTVR